MEETACFGTCTRNQCETERHSTAIFLSISFPLLLTSAYQFNLSYKQLLQHVTIEWVYLRHFCSVWVPKTNSARKILLTLGLFRLSFLSSVQSGDVMRDFESRPFRSIVAVNLWLEARVWRMEGRSREIEEERSRRIDEESWSLKYNPRSFLPLNNPKRVLKDCFQIDRDFSFLHAWWCFVFSICLSEESLIWRSLVHDIIGAFFCVVFWIMWLFWQLYFCRVQDTKCGISASHFWSRFVLRIACS